MRYQRSAVLFGNFKMYEVARSATALRLGIDNTPPADVLDRAYEVARHILQPVREHFNIPFSPSSWYRCEILERFITRDAFHRWMIRKGYNVRTEREKAWRDYFELKSHPKGEAVDFELPGISNIQLFEWCRDNISEYDQLIAEFMKPGDDSAGWIHGSYKVEGNRNQLIEIR